MELALGVTNSLVGRLSTILVDEARLLGGLRGDVEFIKNEMECMNALLRHLNEGQHWDHQQVRRAWIKQVVSLARDCEDNVGVYFHYVGGGNSGQGIVGHLRRINRSLRTIRARHQIATRIKVLKVQVLELGDRRQRYAIDIPSQDKKPDSRSGEKEEEKTIEDGARRVPPQDKPDSRSEEEEEEDLDRRGFLFGGVPPKTIEDGAKKVLDWLEGREDTRRIIYITGDGAVGKTAIAKKVYEDEVVFKSSFLRVWVDFRGYLDMEADKIAQEILKLKPTLPHRQAATTGGALTNQETDTKDRSLLGKARDHIKDQKLLFVFDAHLDEGSNGNHIKQFLCDQVLLYTAPGTTLIYTGRDMPKWYNGYYTDPPGYRPHPFDVYKQQATSLSFYKQRAYGLAYCSSHNDNNDQVSEDNNKVSEQRRKDIDRVLEKCNNDTFALQMFLHLLYVQPTRSMSELLRLHDKQKWNSNNIGETMLMLCYDELPINYKSCLLYLSVFPQGHKIRRTSLLRRWIAEGLIAAATARCKGSKISHGTSRSLEDQAELVFDALVTWGFIRPQDTSTLKIKTVTVHHTTLKLITAEAIADISHVNTGLPPDMAHHLSINNGMALPQGDGFDDVTQTPLESMPGLTQWKLLKVLDLEGCRVLKQKHMKNICKILLLKYLSLRNTDVTKLPKQIEKLQCLETLDIRHTAIRKVFSTKSVTLPMLKYFLAGTKVSLDNSSDGFQESFNGVRLPSGIGRMNKLEVLSGVEVSNNSSEEDLTSIGKLWQLRKLGIVLHGKKDGLGLLFRQIEKLHDCLRSLSIRVNQSNGSNYRCPSCYIKNNDPDAEVVPTTLDTPPKLLEILNICGITFRSEFPQWIADLDHLSQITLQDTVLGEDAVRKLGKLKMLRCLRLLRKTYTINSELHFKAEEFQHLRFLLVQGSDISRIIFDKDAAPKLETMIWSSAPLEPFPLSGVKDHKKLKKLELNGHSYMHLVRKGISHRGQEDGTSTAASSLSSAP